MSMCFRLVPAPATDPNRPGGKLPWMKPAKEVTLASLNVVQNRTRPPNALCEGVGWRPGVYI